MEPPLRERPAATPADRESRQSVAPTTVRRAALNACAAEQWGLLRHADLVRLGVSEQSLHRWTQTGKIHRVHRTVYALAPASTLAPQGCELAAVFACGDGAVLCSVSAAVRWGLLRFPPPQPHVLVRSRGRRRIQGIALHVTAVLPVADVTVRDRIPITTVPRTLVDLAAERSVSDRALESAAAQAERDGFMSRATQLRTAAGARHRTGSPRLRRILHIGPRLWRSAEEAAAAAAIVEAGLPEPVIAHIVRTDIGPLEVDLSFPSQRLVLEVDGRQHDLLLTAARDADRDAALTRAGWAVLRVRAVDVRERPGDVVRRVAAALWARGVTT